MYRHLLVIFLIYGADSEINSSSDLNCDFGSNCLWRNGTNGVEDSGDFAPGTSLQMDDFHKVTALRSDRDDPFVYSSAMIGRQTALLVSDVISCQLGGASLKYWYWKTGADVKLDICIRQPPGSREPTALKCYDGLASTHAQQWIYRSVEFPPISQPFELIFRATFNAPMDIIALDDINYDAILCDVRRGRLDEQMLIKISLPLSNQPLIIGNEDQETTRSKRGSPITIGLEDWRKLRASGNLGKQTMIVVSEDIHVQEETTTEKITSSTTLSPLAAIQQALGITIEPPSTQGPLDKTTVRVWLDEELTTKTSTTTTTESVLSLSQEQHLANMMNFLKGVAPVLPYVPTLVQTLQSLDPRNAAAALAIPESFPAKTYSSPTLNGISPIIPNQNLNTGSNPSLSLLPMSNTNNNHQESLVQMEKRMGIGEEAEPVQFNGHVPDELPKNAFGLGRFLSTTSTPLPNYSTIYPPKIKDIQRDQPRLNGPPPEIQKAIEEEGMDLNELSPDEIKTLEEIHRKIFKHSITTQSSLVIYKKIPKPQVKPIHSEIPFRQEFPSNSFLESQFKQETSRTSLPRIIKTDQSPQLQKTINELAKNPKYGNVSPEMIDKFKEVASGLPPEVLNELSQIQNIPNIDELVEGLDLEMIKSPGGFARLKNEFISRYLRRMMNMPIVPPRGLPPAPIPMKIPRKLLRQMMARSMKARTL